MGGVNECEVGRLRDRKLLLRSKRVWVIEDEEESINVAEVSLYMYVWTTP